MAKTTDTVLAELVAAEIAKQNAATAPVLSDGSTLANVMNDSAPTGQKNAMVASAIAPRRVKCPPADGSKSCSNCMLYHGPATVKTGQKGTTVKNATPQTTPVPATLKIDGCSMAFAAGLPDHVKDAVARETKNPWYPLVVWIAEQIPGHVTISRDGDAKSFKSPMSKLDSAIQRARKMGVKNHGKLDAKSSTEKGVWYLIRRV